MQDRARGSRVRYGSVTGLTALAMVLVVVACAPSADPVTPSAPAAFSGDPRVLVPEPPNAVLTVGAEAPGVDGGHPFVAYSSTDAPDVVAAELATRLQSAGYREIGHRDGWTGYRRPDVQCWISIGSAGPPTSIVVRVAAPDTDPGLVVPPVTTAAGDPQASASPASSAPLAATPEPPSRPGGTGFGQGGNGNGGGNGNAGGSSASHTPAASEHPKPTPKPKPTPTPKP